MNIHVAHKTLQPPGPTGLLFVVVVVVVVVVGVGVGVVVVVVNSLNWSFWFSNGFQWFGWLVSLLVLKVVSSNYPLLGHHIFSWWT